MLPRTQTVFVSTHSSRSFYIGFYCPEHDAFSLHMFSLHMFRDFCPFMAHQKGSFVLLGALQLQKLPPKLHYGVMAQKYTSFPPFG